jgi:hypothetical protein
MPEIGLTNQKCHTWIASQPYHNLLPAATQQTMYEGTRSDWEGISKYVHYLHVLY